MIMDIPQAELSDAVESLAAVDTAVRTDGSKLPQAFFKGTDRSLLPDTGCRHGIDG